jgi:hypothetical protein
MRINTHRIRICQYHYLTDNKALADGRAKSRAPLKRSVMHEKGKT